MRKTCGKILVALLAALLLATGCRSDDDDDLSPAAEYKVLAGRLVWCAESLERVTVPESASSIGNNAFRNCPVLTNVVIPASVEKIGSSTFYGVAVREIEYRDTMRAWDALARGSGIVATLAKITVYCTDGIWGAGMYDWEITNGVLTRYCGDAVDITIPDGVKGIAGGAFAGHAELERVTIPAGVTAVSTGAFAGSGITEITFGGTVADWDAVVEAGGIADELADITVTCADGTWTSAHTHEWSETYTDGGDGTHHQTCAGCDATKTEPHAYGDETCTDAGHSKTCSLCTYSATEPHNWSRYTDDGTDTHSRTCATEGFEAHSESAAHEYAYTDNGDDTHTITCTECEYSKTEEHRYEGSTCLDCKSPRPTAVYVASTGNDDNPGSRTKPFATIQKAIDTVIAMNDGTSTYTIYIDETLKYDDSTYVGTNGMADFSALTQELTLTIKALSGTATLDANKKSRVIYAAPASGTLNLTLENLAITGGNSAGYGGGILFSGKTLEMTGGEVIGCEANNGGGVYIVGGTFTMKSGTISGNTATTNGGGVYVSGSMFEMSGGEVSGNTASGGGGVCVHGNGTFTMSGGEISGNTASASGGGVCVHGNGTFTMSGGEISGNTASASGGGVCVGGSTFEMSGGEISGNTSSGGGGVCVYSNGTFTMSDGEISGNTASGGDGVYVYGGGVYVFGSTFEMSGGEVSGNTASGGGGGVYVSNNGMFTMGGAAKVTEDNNVYLYSSGTTIAVASDLSAATPVATITPYDYTVGRQVLSGAAATLAANCGKFEMSQAGWKIDEAGKLAVASDIYVSEGGDDTSGKGSQAKPFATLQTAFDLIQALNLSTVSYTVHISGTVKGNSELSADVSAQKISITGTAGAKLDGNQSMSTLLTVSCSAPVEITNLTLTNNRKSAILVKSGANVTLGEGAAVFDNNFAMGGVDIVSGGTFTMKSGATISENKNHTGGSGGGGGVRNNGTFIMEGGTISENYVSQANIHGGGVYSSGTFIMKGGEISGNYTSTSYSTGNGGGVYIAGGTFEMTGGTISGNTASSAGKGGGVYVSSGTFTMGGSASIPAGDDGKNDVYLASGRTIAIASGLAAESPVATITPSAYTAGKQVLSAGGVTVTQGICDKFAITKKADGTKWKVAPDAGKGVLKEDTVSTGGGGISVTIPNVGNYTFMVMYNGTPIGDGDELKFGNDIILADVKDSNGNSVAGTFTIELQDRGCNKLNGVEGTTRPLTLPVSPFPFNLEAQIFIKGQLTSGFVIDHTVYVTFVP